MRQTPLVSECPSFLLHFFFFLDDPTEAYFEPLDDFLIGLGSVDRLVIVLPPAARLAGQDRSLSCLHAGRRQRFCWQFARPRPGASKSLRRRPFSVTGIGAFNAPEIVAPTVLTLRGRPFGFGQCPGLKRPVRGSRDSSGAGRSTSSLVGSSVHRRLASDVGCRAGFCCDAPWFGVRRLVISAPLERCSIAVRALRIFVSCVVRCVEQSTAGENRVTSLKGEAVLDGRGNVYDVRGLRHVSEAADTRVASAGGTVPPKDAPTRRRGPNLAA